MFYKVGSPENLADKIEYVLEHPNEVRRKEIEAQKYILQLTDVEQYTEKMLRLYRRICK